MVMHKWFKDVLIVNYIVKNNAQHVLMDSVLIVMP